MGDQQVLNGVIAVMIGLALGVVLFVPFVAISYRRRGRLTIWRLLLWLSALIYFWAIWTYTLLPLPDPDAIRCVGAILDPMSVVRDVQAGLRAGGNPLGRPEILQLVFNVLLFTPLGFFVRVLGGRGFLVALAVGLGLSLFIETTQLTGVWGLYPCAYRFFDVGDLMTNITGAVLGSIAGLVVPRRLRGLDVSVDARLPHPVTRGRRALAMLCDGLGYTFLAAAIGVAVQLWFGYVVHDERNFTDGTLAGDLGTAAAIAVWLIVILATGRSIGDLAVQLRYDGSRMPAFLARLLRWLGGVAGIGAIGLIPGGLGISGALSLLACVMFFFTKKGRGLPGLLSGQHLRDAREGADQDSARPARQ